MRLHKKEAARPTEGRLRVVTPQPEASDTETMDIQGDIRTEIDRILDRIPLRHHNSEEIRKFLKWLFTLSQEDIPHEGRAARKFIQEEGGFNVLPIYFGIEHILRHQRSKIWEHLPFTKSEARDLFSWLQ